MAVDFTRVWNWYSRESVQRAILEISKGREIVSIYKEGNYGKRPNTLSYPGDILQAVAEGSVAFHGSVEHWSNPMKLDVGMAKLDQDALRTGWDIFIDPDVPDFEIAKIIVRKVIEAMKDHGVMNYSVKFSGGKGFHVGVPFRSLPEKINLQPSSAMYPDLLQKIIEFIKWYTRDSMKEALLELGQPNAISQRVNKPMADIMSGDELDPFKVVSMDIFSSRHLFRLPYSLHEKSMLVSMPVRPDKVEAFEKEMAQPEKAKVDEKFLQSRVPSHDAEALVVEALDWASKHRMEVQEVAPKKKIISQKTKFIPEEMFPPCIKKMLDGGMSDGKKRAVFVLINFLRNMGWRPEQVEKRLVEWNEKNYPPLRANYLRGQMRWHFRAEKPMLPPNCDNQNYYKSLGVFECCKQLHDAGVKNPVSYPFRILKARAKERRKKKK